MTAQPPFPFNHVYGTFSINSSTFIHCIYCSFQVQSTFIAMFLFFMNQIGGNLPIIISPLETWLHNYRFIHELISSANMVSYYSGFPYLYSGLRVWLSAHLYFFFHPFLFIGKKLGRGSQKTTARI